MPTIKIPFPIHEGFEVKNATIDLENGYTVVEYGEKEKFNRGDICKLGSNEIHIFGSRRDGSNYEKKYFDRIVAYIINEEKLYFGVDAFGYFGEYHRLATPSEQQLLFDALAKDGLRWNDDTKEVEPIQ